MTFDFWHVDASALQAVRADQTGVQFVRFMNSLIDTEATISGLPSSEVQLNLQWNLKDGGADAIISSAVPKDTSGWMRSPTVWQYKRSKLSAPQLRQEINKPNVRECIKKGYAYRLCICEAESAPQMAKKEAILAKAQQSINQDAPAPRILTTPRLATWVSRYPALVLTYIHSGVAGKFFDLNTWKENITSATPIFVPMEKWTATFEDIQEYADFQLAPPTIPFLIKGEAGIGKTRLGYESLAARPGSSGLVIYCTDGQEACATYLAMSREVRAILVADECDAPLRESLKRAVTGFQDRIRIIAINAESTSHSGGREYFLTQLDSKDVERVLSQNFPEVPPESRRRYADLCGGFIGLAADMCRYHPQIAASGDMGPVMQSVEDYYRRRLPDSQRKHIEALALLPRVGFKRDRGQELDDLCHALDLSPLEVKHTANSVHSSPGFVGIGGSYLYVRPKIIARVAFGEAWHRWGSSDTEQFLATFPPTLLDQFLEGAKQSATEGVKRLIASSFRSWAAKLEPKDLTDGSVVERLCALVETHPNDFLPRLRFILEAATTEQVFDVRGEWQGKWGPRRTIVWLCERLAAFPEYFDDVEPILLKLALAESEPKIGNNATHIWIQLFRIYLSGTSIPFHKRLDRLKEHIYSKSKAVSLLALDAVGKLLDPYGSRIGGPSVVAGRIPPEEWVPQGNEAAQSVLAILDVLRELTQSPDPRFKQAATHVALENLYNLLIRGYLEKLKEVLDPATIGDEARAKAVGAIEHFLYLEREYAPSDFKVDSSYREKVENWKNSLELTDIRGKMFTLLGTNDWAFSGDRREQWLDAIKELAKSLFAESQILISQFDWLFSDAAKGSGLLGEEFGKLDVAGRLMSRIIGAAVHLRNSGLARGYIFGYLSQGNADIERLNKLLDRAEGENAQIAYELFIAGGTQTKACERTLSLVRSGKLSVRHFRSLGLGAGGNRLTVENIIAILELLIEKIDAGDVDATETAIEVVAYNCLERPSEKTILLDQGLIQDCVWKITEKAARNVGRSSFWWTKILERLAPTDLPRAAKIAADGLLGEGIEQPENSGNILATIAEKNPATAMDAIGNALMDEKLGWRFFVGRHDFIKRLPTMTVINWVDDHGVEAARRIARHLPAPHLSPEGNPIVPPLTKHILAKFGDDKRVFSEFVAGVHNLQGYMGDIAGQKQHDADVARKFLKYPSARIQEWAQIEIRDAENQAAFWKELEEEHNLE
jgi:hypothetical protein